MIRLRKSLVFVALLLAGACSDPLSGVDRLSDVPLAAGTATATVVPGASDAAGAPPVLPGLLAGLFGDGGGSGDATVTPASVVIAGAAPLPPGATVPYGVLATVCGVDAASLGSPVASASGYAVYDTDPTTTAPRTQYITGFEDGCARQFYAALAIFGDIGTHELVRYSEAAGDGYSGTDRAYETLKAAYCGVAEGVPCGARLEALAARTTFLTVYESFGTENGWADILLSDGRVIADDF